MRLRDAVVRERRKKMMRGGRTGCGAGSDAAADEAAVDAAATGFQGRQLLAEFGQLLGQRRSSSSRFVSFSVMGQWRIVVNDTTRHDTIRYDD